MAEAMNVLASELLNVVLNECDIGSKQVVRRLTKMERILHEAQPGKEREFLAKQMPQLREDTLADFLSNRYSDSQVEVAAVFGERGNLEFYSEEQLAVIFRRPSGIGWAGFREHFPKSRGILEIGRPGFSSDQKQALLEIGQQLDRLHGFGSCFLCDHEVGRWKVLKRVRTWVS